MAISYSFKIVTLGDPGVGKTSILDRYVNNRFEMDYLPTIGANFFTKNISVNAQNIQMNFWDLGGQEAFKIIRKSYLLGSAAAMFVCDLSRVETYLNLEIWFDDVIEVLKEPIPYIVIGNKTDLVQNIPEFELPVSFPSEKCIAKELCSAKTSLGIENIFQELARAVCKLKK